MILTATARRKGAKRHIVARGDLEELRRIAKNVNKKNYHTVIYSGDWKEVEVCNV